MPELVPIQFMRLHGDGALPGVWIPLAELVALVRIRAGEAELHGDYDGYAADALESLAEELEAVGAAE